MIMDQFEIFAADIDYGTDYLNIMETTRFLSAPDLAWSDAQVNFQHFNQGSTDRHLNFRVDQFFGPGIPDSNYFDTLTKNL